MSCLPILAICIGCNDNQMVSHDSREAEDFELKNKPKQVITLEADCGVMLPDTKTTASFNVVNDSDFNWKIKKIGVSCVCTVADTGVDEIEIGQSATIDVVYKVPAVESDDRRRIVIHFEDPRAPLVALYVSARVRNKHSVIPARLMFDDFEGSGPRFGSVTIENHSGVNWRNVNVTKPKKWGKVSVAQVGDTLDEFQTFRLDFEVQTNDILRGLHRQDIGLTANLAGNLSVDLPDLPITVSIRPNVTCSPSNLFLGRCNPNDEIPKRVALRILNEDTSVDWNEVIVKTINGTVVGIDEINPISNDEVGFVLRIVTPSSTGNWKDTVLFCDGRDSRPFAQLPLFLSNSEK